MLSPSTTLTGLPPSLRDELLDAFRAIANNYVERRWEPSELNGGKFCEAVYCVIEGAISGAMPPHATKPSNMVAACRDLEKKPANASLVGDRSLRILIPRTLLAMYEIRNNRNVGHVGGDVNPNFMDATVVYSMASWTLAELVRIFHNISTQEAQALVDSLVERKSPLIWELEDIKMRRVAFHRGVVVTVATPAHAAHDAVRFKKALPILAGELATLIGVQQQACSRFTSPHCASNACNTRSVCGVERVAQPTI